jgi:hypothetical protein
MIPFDSLGIEIKMIFSEKVCVVITCYDFLQRVLGSNLGPVASYPEVLLVHSR